MQIAASEPDERHREPGPCERQLKGAVTRGALWLRAAVVGLCGTFGLTGYDRATVPLVAMVVVIATIMPCLQAWFRTAVPTAFLIGGALLAALIGLSQLVFGAQSFSGWIVAAVGITSVSCYFEWPDRPVTAHGIACVTIAAYCAGCVLASGQIPVATSARALVQAVLAWTVLLMVRRAARICDELVRRAAQRRAAAAAARAQRAADRAHLAMLHDTASTTFLMVTTNTTGEFDWLAAQAGRDLKMLTAKSAVPNRDIDLSDLLESLRDYQGLDIDVQVTHPLIVPAPPAFAIYHGVREGLSNVRRHAGDRVPRLTARGEGGQVVVQLSDRGRGFEPRAVPPHRWGLSHSVRGRMAEVGGRAEVRSTLGGGTTVLWTWSRG